MGSATLTGKAPIFEAERQATTAPDHARSSAREWTIQPILILGELCIAPES
jgi:hypothetical protein